MRYNRKRKYFIDNEQIVYDNLKIYPNEIVYRDVIVNDNNSSHNTSDIINNIDYADNINYNINNIKGINAQEKILEYSKNKIYDYNYILTPYNKMYFYDLDFIELTIKQFSAVKIYSNDYEYLLYIKFLNSYLDHLDEENLSKILIFFIAQPEAENIFFLINNILETLNTEIVRNLNNNTYYNSNNDDNYINEISDKSLDKNIVQKDSGSKENDKVKDEKMRYIPNIFENDFDIYELTIDFITKLSANNNIIQCKMKDYLRVQFNNSRSYNFISILSNILINFIKKDSHLNYIDKYYKLIIQIIDCITKCCNGPSKDNQDCVVMETELLNFAREILKNITYRKKEFYDSGLNLIPSKNRYCLYTPKNNEIIDKSSVINLNRKKLSFLKLKLLILMSVLTLGRKKEDYLYEKILNKIDFDVLACIIIETYKEILIEKGCQRNYENLIFDEDMLLRMNRDIYSPDNTDENFIIFEIGTYTFILINLFMEHLTRQSDCIMESISNYNQKLKKKRYEVKKSSIFNTTKAFGYSVYRCFRELCIKCGNCLSKKEYKDFHLENSFNCAYSFYFDYTPSIEILSDNTVIKYYVKLSPICKCLTEEMKDEFYSKLVGCTTNAKIETIFKNVDYYHYQFVHAKRRLDLFRKMPLLDLFLNHYKFYEDVFMIIGALLNILLFASLYRTNDDYESVEKYSDNFKYDYGFLYKHKNINITRNIFFGVTFVETIFAFLILMTYISSNWSNYFYYEISESEKEELYKSEEEKWYDFGENDYIYINLDDYEEMRKKINIFSRVFSFIVNIIKDAKLFYHLIILADCLIALISKNYKFLVLLLVEIIIHSDTLICIVKSFWLPKRQLITTLILFYLIAYYFFIFVYLFIPHHLPTRDCFKFSDCFFTLCDQTIKNSNGIINYLIEDGLYITNTLYQNPRFWIDNLFAIIDLMLVLQMVCGIITDSYISQKNEKDKFINNKNKICFICGLGKPELIKYYENEQGFEEHIKVDHYLWNYMFLIFNVSKKKFDDLINLDKDILDNYRKGNYSNYVPYKNCCKKVEVEEKNTTEGNEDKKTKDYINTNEDN